MDLNGETYSSSSQFTRSNNNNLVPRFKMPSFSLHKTAQQAVMAEKMVVQQHEKSSEQQRENGTGSKMLSLHDKLRKEADKIRPWKLETETELKNKEKQIDDSTQMIENIRKYILELQTKNEDLSFKFQSLNISAIEEQNMLKSEIGKYSFEKEDIGKCFEKSVQDAERQHKLYAENLLQKESQIKAITEQLKDYEKQKAEEGEMIVHLGRNIQDLKEGIENKESEIEQLIKEVDTLTKAKSQLSKEYEETQLYLSEIEEKYKSLENQMSQETNQHSCELEALQVEIKDVKEQYEKVKEMHVTFSTKEAQSMKLIEDLKHDKDILILEKANLDTTLKNEIHSKNELQINLEKKIDQIKHLNRCIIELNDELDVVKKEHSKTQSQVKESNKLFSDLQYEFTQITKEKELLQKELDKKNTENVHFQEKLNIIEKREEFRMEQSNQNLAEINHQNSQLTKNLSDIKIKMKLDKEKYQNDINELEKCKQDANGTIDNFTHEQEQLQSQIKDFKETIHQLEKGFKQHQKEKETLLIDKQTFENMTKQKETAEKEREEAMDNCEILRQEMMMTLEKYTKEHDKIMYLKEKEIETIHTKNKLQNQEVENKFNNDLKGKKYEWEKEKQNLKDKMSDFSKEFAVLKRENKELQNKVDKAATNNVIGEQISSNRHNKTPIFLSRKTPQKAVYVTPQISQGTPFLKAESNISRKRKVVFNSENASIMSDTDSSLSEYGHIPQDDIQSNSLQSIACYGRIKSKTKENVLKDVQENISKSKNRLKVQKEIKKKDFTANVLSEENYDEIQPKKIRSSKKTPNPNLRKTLNSKSEISKSPTKVNKSNNKSEKEDSFWFDNVGMDD